MSSSHIKNVFVLVFWMLAGSGFHIIYSRRHPWGHTFCVIYELPGTCSSLIRLDGGRGWRIITIIALKTVQRPLYLLNTLLRFTLRQYKKNCILKKKYMYFGNILTVTSEIQILRPKMALLYIVIGHAQSAIINFKSQKNIEFKLCVLLMTSAFSQYLTSICFCGPEAAASLCDFQL